MTFTYHPYVSKAAILFLVILLVASCGVLPRKPSPDTLAMIGEGRASWYGPEFHGKRTANGETYNMNQLTAAHRTLPFNTRVRVDNLENGQSVIVRINDRGPYIGNRIIDLSREAATQLGMIRNETANVRLRSEEHTSELQSRGHIVCRLLLEKNKIKFSTSTI